MPLNGLSPHCPTRPCRYRFAMSLLRVMSTFLSLTILAGVQISWAKTRTASGVTVTARSISSNDLNRLVSVEQKAPVLGKHRGKLLRCSGQIAPVDEQLGFWQEVIPQWRTGVGIQRL